MQSLMSLLFATVLLFSSAVAQSADSAHAVDIQVSGMTCPFCVYGVKKKLEELPGVAKAQVNLDKKMARITPKPGQELDLDRIRGAIAEAGFTPGKVLSGEATGGNPK